MRRGIPTFLEEGAAIKQTGLRALWRSVGILAMCVREAPEFASRRRHKAGVSE